LVCRAWLIGTYAYARAFSELGLNDGDYGVLVALRRAGAPHELTPTELSRERMMTSGGMTAAIDRLERQGLVSRSANPKDRRGTLIRLTTAGRKAVDRAMEVHAQAERRLVAGLDSREQRQLSVLLRKLLLSVEDRT
jgi:DNA-binding MarR family transcriptional regulator